jgi:hypothetical protein
LQAADIKTNKKELIQNLEENYENCQNV